MKRNLVCIKKKIASSNQKIFLCYERPKPSTIVKVTLPSGSLKNNRGFAERRMKIFNLIEREIVEDKTAITSAADTDWVNDLPRLVFHNDIN